ncbi:ABC transporter G family member 29 [Zostera marina]|uniref:ABC transporter G family member 29 n=1 Tax=Zostera marina TaxID=29655 RepID=A0A0K9Q5D1_ZOSMR|nr:ABC transporter G family member 29 [Zostera marina]
MQDIFNIARFIYSAVMFIGVQNSQMIQPVVDIERMVFYRERSAGMYSALPYAFGQVIIQIPYTLFQAVIYCSIVYSMTQFVWTVAKFFWFMFFIFGSFLYFTYYGMMAVGLTPNSTIASIVSTIFYSIWNIFGGFIIPRTRIPKWWRWYYYECPVGWSINGLITSQYGESDDIISDIGVSNETVKAYLRRYFGYHHDVLGYILLAIIAFNVAFAFIFALSIKKLNFQKH